MRFLVPEGATRFDDLVHGPIEFDGANIEDFVILRSDGQPTYHLSVVSDDVEMKMTHVVRGDDHISNTPKHVLLYQAVGAPVPQFAHVPLILGADKKRLSKRHGATSVMEYARQGYLPEAMVNFLALLGWSPGSGDRELFTRDELVRASSICEGISGGNAVFNPEKLDWFNQQYIMRLAPEELARAAAALVRGGRAVGRRRISAIATPGSSPCSSCSSRARNGSTSSCRSGSFFFADDVEYDAAAVDEAPAGRRHGRAPARRSTAAFAALETFDPASLETALRGVAEARGLKAGTLIHAVRVAVTGRTVSPGLFEVLSLLGRERVRRRLTLPT